MNIKSKIMEFENQLDQELENLDIMEYNRFESIEAVGTTYEIAKHNYKSIWGGAIDVLIPKLLNNLKGEKSNIPDKAIFSALDFAQNYYHLRDYFYFIYNVPKSMEWQISGNSVSIKLLDDSFQLQQFLEMNSWFLTSRKAFLGFDSIKRKIEKYVEKTKEEFVESKTLELAFEGCIKEAKIKLQAYPNFLTDNFIFDSYSVGQFKSVYEYILARVLLKRYFIQKHIKNKNPEHGWILAINRKEFINALSEASKVPDNLVEQILLDLTLDSEKIKKNYSTKSFPLIYNLDEDCYFLFPFITSLCECYDSLRKAWALRNPELYGEKVANTVGEELAKRVYDMFKKNGFQFEKKNVSLKQFGSRLPDIDVLSIWEEPGFGYVVFICETKNPIPEMFGKDFIRSISSTGFITKAQKQINDISKVLKGKSFYKLLKSNFPNTKLGFGLYALNFLIVTSQNIGVFSSGKTIIDSETLERFLESSESDILKLLTCLKRENLLSACKKCSEIIYKRVNIGSFEITFPVISLKSLLSIE